MWLLSASKNIFPIKSYATFKSSKFATLPQDFPSLLGVEYWGWNIGGGILGVEYWGWNIGGGILGVEYWTCHQRTS